jgi:AcrR family transcriptional regulator
MPPSRREELIDAAMRVFYRNGFHNTGLDMILSESGISRMTLYNHFKSKDELIVAALRRRDELFRNRMMKHVESASQDPIARLLAVFDWHADWFRDPDFSGCMFINASAEYADLESPMRRVSAEHKLEVVRYLVELTKAAKADDPGELAQELNLLLEGAIVNVHVVCRVGNNPHTVDETADRARRLAEQLIAKRCGS